MAIKRRDFLQLAAIATTATGMMGGGLAACASNKPKAAGGSLSSMSSEAKPITLVERQARIAKAQRLMTVQNIKALVLDAGTSMDYFTGTRWGASERTMVAIIPASGDVIYICPAFEKDRLEEQINIGKEVFVWEEDESPYELIVTVLKNAGIASGTIGIEERVRFFIANGIQKAAPHLQLVSGDPITIPCRSIKSPAEIGLMQMASNITIRAIQHSVARLEVGMSQRDISAMIMRSQNELGGRAEFALCLVGVSSAFPHGTKNSPTLKKGDIVLMDCGCSVYGYQSDITRTIVFGADPTTRQEEIWNLEKQSQAAGFAAAQIGMPCEVVDAAARKVITEAGFGPGYKTPGLPHRTGHGIGMDGHEWGNMVKGNKQPLEAGMCFSIEPTIAIPGEFGVRFEDCVYMTADGPRWFSQPSKSIREPFG